MTLAAAETDAMPHWRLPLGRHRVAIRFALSLIALSYAGPLLQSAADGMASVPLIGGLLDGIAMMLSAQATARVLSGGLCLLYLRRIHPAANGQYAATLALTPWHPTRPLPAGDVTLTSSFVLLPALAIALLSLVGMQKTSLSLVYGVVTAYALTGIIAAIVARRDVIAYVLALLLIIAAPVISFEVWFALIAIGGATLALSSVAHHAAIVRCWTIGTNDFRRFQVIKRSRLGWFDNLPTRRPARPWAALVFVPLMSGVLVASIATIADGTRGQGARDGLTGVLLFVTFFRFAYSVNLSPFSYGLLARAITGRVFVPRMDQVFLAPLALLAWVGLLRLLPWPVRSDWVPILAGGALAIGGWIAVFVAPSKLRWQILGTTRIALIPTKQQKQQEANLKRWTATTDSAAT